MTRLGMHHLRTEHRSWDEPLPGADLGRRGLRHHARELADHDSPSAITELLIPTRKTQESGR